MTFFFVFIGGIALILWIIALMDWFARRRDRQAEHRAR